MMNARYEYDYEAPCIDLVDISDDIRIYRRDYPKVSALIEACVEWGYINFKKLSEAKKAKLIMLVIDEMREIVTDKYFKDGLEEDSFSKMLLDIFMNPHQFIEESVYYIYHLTKNTVDGIFDAFVEAQDSIRLIHQF